MGEPIQRRIIAIIPFYAQNGGAYGSGRAFSPATKRFEYLQKTIESLHAFVSQIIIGVCTDLDEQTALSLVVPYKNVVVRQIVTKRPEWLITDLCKYAQQNTDSE